jgi:glutathione S-transferase
VTQQLGFVTTELHKKVLAMLFNPAAPDAVKEFVRGEALKPLKVLQQSLERQEFAAGNSFSVADAYLIWALTLLPRAGVPLDDFSAVRSYAERTTARPAVARALRTEMREQAEPPPQAPPLS